MFTYGSNIKTYFYIWIKVFKCFFLNGSKNRKFNEKCKIMMNKLYETFFQEVVWIVSLINFQKYKNKMNTFYKTLKNIFAEYKCSLCWGQWLSGLWSYSWTFFPFCPSNLHRHVSGRSAFLRRSTSYANLASLDSAKRFHFKHFIITS